MHRSQGQETYGKYIDDEGSYLLVANRDQPTTPGSWPPNPVQLACGPSPSSLTRPPCGRLYSVMLSKRVRSAKASKRCWIAAADKGLIASRENDSTENEAITLPVIMAVRMVSGSRLPA